MNWRQEILDWLGSEPEVSVLVVGGGINGIGTFRELAAQGIDVLLVEKDDFCSGASAASSHMLHGGIRYLENGEFRLVNEALKERDLMLRNAPHYSKPAPTVIPIFGWTSGLLNAPLKFFRLLNRPSERGYLVIKIGLMIYDWFTRSHRTMPTHKTYSRKESLAKRPQLNPSIIATAQYYDVWMPTPERISLELVLDGEQLHEKARAINYMMLDGGEGNSITLRDTVTDKSYTVKPKIVINAAGPWIDFANHAMQKSTRFIGGTKGSHLVVDNPELHSVTQGSEFFFENNDGRIVLFFPLEDKVLMGTTDIPVETPDGVVCTEEEVDYIIGLVGRVFPTIKVDRSQIVFKFSGVRPLPYSDSANAGQISRDHSIEVTEPDGKVKYPVYSLVGGKWTTFRAFSEQTADKVLDYLGKPRKVDTENMPIGGGRDYPEDAQQWVADVAEEMRLPVERVQMLFDRYGTRAAEIAAFMASAPDKPLEHQPDYSQREVLFIAQHEKMVHLDDFILRRSLMAMLGRLSRPLLAELAAVMGEAVGWSEDEQQAEVQRTLKLLKANHDVTLK